jgi:arylsulfatase A-like enzyme
MGHLYGPDAPEALAHFALLDEQLGRLLDGLDAQVGKGRYVTLLTSDHGAAPLPELMKARHLDAGHADAGALVAALKKEADAALGPADWFAPYKTPGLTANPDVRAKLHTIDARLRAVARQQPGVLELLSSDELAKPGSYGSLGDLYRRGFVPGRTPDFIVVTRPYWTTEGAGRSGHASAYLYDRAVPLLVAGPGIAHGEAPYADAQDVAPTLARLLHAPPPAAARGHAIPEVFR